MLTRYSSLSVNAFAENRLIHKLEFGTTTTSSADPVDQKVNELINHDKATRESTSGLPVVAVTVDPNTVLDLGDRVTMTLPIETRASLASQRVARQDESGVLGSFSGVGSPIPIDETQLETAGIKGVLPVIRGIGASINSVDKELEKHNDGMAQLSYIIGKKLGLNEAEAIVLYLGTYLHDVGKLDEVINKITNKEGRLTDDEFNQIRQHCELGAIVLKSFGIPAKIREIALFHHEKFNGKGYPFGLSATEIPFTSRVATLADVFDALSRKRPYKTAKSIRTTMDIIRNTSSPESHFDPSIVWALIHILDEAGVDIESDEMLVIEDIVAKLGMEPITFDSIAASAYENEDAINVILSGDSAESSNERNHLFIPKSLATALENVEDPSIQAISVRLRGKVYTISLISSDAPRLIVNTDIPDESPNNDLKIERINTPIIFGFELSQAVNEQVKAISGHPLVERIMFGDETGLKGSCMNQSIA